MPSAATWQVAPFGQFPRNYGGDAEVPAARDDAAQPGGVSVSGGGDQCDGGLGCCRGVRHRIFVIGGLRQPCAAQDHGFDFVQGRGQ
jgi:hypothetical protein